MRIVLTTVRTFEAEGLARALVEERLAACVQVVPEVRSTYRWEGAIVVDTEAQLWCKTSTARVGELVARLREIHPYTLPEIVVIDVDESASDGDYVDWVRAGTIPEGTAEEMP
jgi:periplasmic divalent cation tolerance protein